MRLLLDTQLAVWWQIAAGNVPESARSLVQSADGPVFISRASLWEMAIKASIGKLHIDLAAFCRQLMRDGFEWLEISQAHLLAVASLPLHEDHKDPFDRLLIAQSLTEPLIFVTTDDKLMRYGSTVRFVQ